MIEYSLDWDIGCAADSFHQNVLCKKVSHSKAKFLYNRLDSLAILESRAASSEVVRLGPGPGARAKDKVGVSTRGYSVRQLHPISLGVVCS